MSLNSYFCFPYILKREKIPTTGIHLEDGSLFYHYVPQKLSQRQLERIQECDVEINDSPEFSKDEDRLILENVKEVSRWDGVGTKNGMFYFIGYRRFEDMEIIKYKKALLLTRRGFWTRLCKGLDDRTAIQVYRRICLLFDTYYDGDDHFDEDDRRVAKKMYRECSNLRLISRDLKVPLICLIEMFCEKQEDQLVDQSLHNYEKKLIYNFVMENSQLTEKALMGYILAKTSAEEIMEKSRTNFQALEKSLKLKEEDIKDEWKKIVLDMIEVCRIWSLDKKETNITMKYLKFKVIGNNNYDDQFIFMLCLIRSVRKGKTYLEEDAIDMEKLKNLLNKEYCEHISNTLSRKGMTSIYFYRILNSFEIAEKEIFQFLSNLPLREKLVFIYESIVRANSSMNRLTFIKPSGKIKKYAYTLNVDILYQVVSIYFKMTHDEWNPPLQLKRLALKNEPLLDMFSPRSKKSRKRKSEDARESNSLLRSRVIENDKNELDQTQNSNNGEISLRWDETILAKGGHNEIVNETCNFEETVEDGEETTIMVTQPTEEAENWLELLDNIDV